MTAPAGRRPGGRQIVPRPAAWSPGPPAPWAGGAAPTLDEVLAAVPEHDRPVLPAFPEAKASAVLIALADGVNGPEVLLTRRSWELRHHRGEVSFPGGRLDPGETPVDAALREAHEEVGLDPAGVWVRGELDPGAYLLRALRGRQDRDVRHLAVQSRRGPPDGTAGGRASCDGCPWPNGNQPRCVSQATELGRRLSGFPIVCQCTRSRN